jgi:hypothetical protein
MRINIVFEQGMYKISVHFESGNFNLNFLESKKLLDQNKVLPNWI